MRQQPSTRPEPAPAETRQDGGGSPPAQKAADLTVNKILAGAGAAATSAVLGSYFGATGTVAGAALGSVASTLTTTLYQRSLDRTRDTLVARVRLPRGRQALADAPTVRLAVPEPRVSPEDATTRLRVQPALRRPRRIWVWLGVTVLVFALGLLAVTGIEWAKGSTLSTGQEGTSVGRVLAPGPTTDDAGTGASEPDGATDDADAGSSEGGDASDTDGSDDERSATDGSDTRSSDGAGSDRSDGTDDPDRSGGADGSGSDGAGDADEDSGSGAEPTTSPSGTAEPEPGSADATGAAPTGRSAPGNG